MKKLLFIACLFIVSFAKAQIIKEFQVNFETASYEISKNEATKINDVLKPFIDNSKDYSIQIIGHTDNVGDLDYNYLLSNNRAKTIADYIENKGFDKTKIYSSGRAYLKPTAKNTSEIGKAKNRRVTIKIFNEKEDNFTINGLELKENQYTISTSKLETIEYKSGTKITIPENAFVDKIGNPVTGIVTISYIEFRDPADFILGNIPMDYNDVTGNYHFNSAGMFKILATQNGKNISLKEGKNITLGFQKTQELSNLNFYELDSKTKNWKELYNLNNGKTSFYGTIDNVIDGGNDVVKIDQLEYSICQLNNCDAFTTLKKIGVNYSENIDLIERKYNNQIKKQVKDRKNNNEALESTIENYKTIIEEYQTKIKNFETKIKKSEPNYVATKISNDENQEIFNIGFSVKSNVQNINFKNTNWLNKSDINGKINQSIYNKNWNNCSIESNEDKTFTIILKDSTSEISIKNVAMINLNVSEDKLTKVSNSMNNSYKIQQNRIKKFKRSKDKFIKKNEEVAKILNDIEVQKRKLKDTLIGNLSQNSIVCFWEKSKDYMTTDEAKLSIQSWLNYFDKNKEVMLKRYSTLQISEDCKKQTAQIFEANKKIVENQKYSNTANNTAKELNQSLQISKLGIYNCDQIQRLQNPIEIFANYTDEKGNELNPVFIYLLDSNFNGVIKYDGYNGLSPFRFAFSPQSKNTMIAFDGNGNSYIYKSEKFSEININGSYKHHDFIMTKINNLKSIDDLKAQL
ncbi:OmpA family protein [Flavobacterium sp. SUN052]|uniref:OmpA family protein n=1 Tax=Flavobacterium sp. SUN052 TaxID=3002441 RepID=UPI00237D905A|nr:OmpA family protein [Flavobacterium sp. SUN052]MEC4005769.1 OmpA family protein [Flavobacterium sp. SUN052]